MTLPSGNARRRAPATLAAAAALLCLGAYPTCSHTQSVFPHVPPGRQATDVESLLADAEASSALSLGAVSWWKDLEVCFPDTQGGYQPAHLGTPRSENCHFDAPEDNAFADAPVACKCYFAIEQDRSVPGAPSLFKIWLDTFVKSNLTAMKDGRNSLIQLSPIFTDFRSVPPYLTRERFDSNAMKTAFHRLVDKIAETLEGYSETDLATGRVRRPFFRIAIGNEIDGYLNDPSRDGPGVGSSCSTDSNCNQTALGVGKSANVCRSGQCRPIDADAWGAYKDFYIDAADYVKTHPRSFYRQVSFSTRWSDPSDHAANDYDSCGPGKLLADLLQLPGNRTGAPSSTCSYDKPTWDPVGNSAHLPVAVSQAAVLESVNAFLEMSRHSDVWTYTYYPHAHDGDSGIPQRFAVSRMAVETLYEFRKMRTISDIGNRNFPTSTPFPTGPRPIIIQEIGYSHATSQQEQADYVWGATTARRLHADEGGLRQAGSIIDLHWYLVADFPAAPFDTYGLTDTNLVPYPAWDLFRLQTQRFNREAGTVVNR